MLFNLFLLTCSILKLGDTLNTLPQPESNKEFWRNDLKRHVIDLLHQHHRHNNYQHNDIGFLQFGNNTNDFVGDFLSKYKLQIADWAKVIGQRPLKMPNVVVTKNQIVVIVMGYFDQKNLQKFLKEMSTSTFWYGSSPILLMPIFPIKFKTNAWLLQLFSMFNQEYLFNVAIIYYTQEYNRIERVAYNPFAQDPLEFDANYLFYNKVLNLNEYELKVAHYEQGTRFQIKKDGTIFGVDGYVCLIVCRHLNATYKIISVEGALEKDKHTKVNELILARRADISFNFKIYFNTNYSTVKIVPIFPYELETIVLMIPAARLIPSYRHFIDPFSPALWLTIAFTFFLSSGILYFAIRALDSLGNRELIDIWKELVQIHLSQPLPQSVRNKSKRVIYSFLAIYTFILFHSYQTKLTSFLMTSRYYKNYQSISEVNNSQLKLITAGKNEKMVKIFLANQLIFNTQIETNLSIWKLKSNLEHQNEEDFELDYGFFVRKQEATLFVTSYLNEIRGEKLLEIIDEAVLSSTISYTVLRGNPLEPVINNIVCRLRECGLYRYYENMLMHRTEMQKRQYNVAHKVVHKDSMLSFIEFLPVVRMFLTGITLSFCCFILELMFESIRNKVRRLLARLNQKKVPSNLKKAVQ